MMSENNYTHLFTEILPLQSGTLQKFCAIFITHNFAHPLNPLTTSNDMEKLMSPKYHKAP